MSKRPVLKLSLALGLILGLALPATASSFLDVPSGDMPMFRVEIFDKGETYPEAGIPSGFTLSTKERQLLSNGIRYWSDLLAPYATNKNPLYISLITVDDSENYGNATAGSHTSVNAKGFTDLAAGLYNPVFQNSTKYLAGITVNSGNAQGTRYEGPMGSIPQNGINCNLTAIMLHEMAHALGMMSSSYDGTVAGLTWNATLSNWDKNLRDINGNASRPGQKIMDVSDGNPGTDFIVNLKKIMDDNGLLVDCEFGGTYLAGKEVMDVLTVDGKVAQLVWPENPNLPKVPGLPMNKDMSHIELRNVSMSHQRYRNYTIMTEAELAALQGAGLKMDRRNMYGFSIYNDGLTYVNNNPYYARTADGKWIEGQANPTAYGTGLHVYGSNNNLRQSADLLSSGAYGLGIRMDGFGNTLTIDPHVRVQASGEGGNGLAIAYGTGHSIVQRGILSAMGKDGIGARFDFGDNTMGNDVQYRGSWIQSKWNVQKEQWENFAPTLLGELQGALVNSFDVTGAVGGTKAAIYIGENAQVKNINIMQGAALQGDIVSNWDINDARIRYEGAKTDLITTLSFGLQSDANGKATAKADSAFAMRYDGNINASKGLSLSMDGGILSYNGKASVIGVAVKSGATLMGNGEYVVNKDAGYGGAFINAGTLSPGNSIGKIVINGDYRQTSKGMLHMEFDATSSDSLIVKGNSTIQKGSSILLVPMRDFYATNSKRTLTSNSLFGDTMNLKQFSGIGLMHEKFPTMSFDFPEPDSSAVIIATRKADAYSQYAAHSNGNQVGKALYGISSVDVQGDMRTLFATLDFSASDGSAVRSGLKQLSPQSHGYSAQASAEGNLMIGRMALDQLRQRTTVRSTAVAENADQQGLAAGSAPNEWVAFVAPFASTSVQQQDGNVQGYNSSQTGLMGGLYRQVDSFSLGVYTAFARRQLDAWSSETAQTKATSLSLGGMAQYKPEPTGWHVFAQAQIGLENIDGQRDIRINDYQRQNQSFSTAFSGTAMLGGGWQWQMDNVAFGPYLGLEYALNMLPQTQEWGGQATRLNMDAFTRHDLRGVLGANLVWSKELTEDRQIKATLDAAWRQDLLNTDYTMRSALAGYGNYGFDTTISRQGQGSLGLRGSLEVDVRKDVSIGAQVQADVLRQGYNSLGGALSVRWEF